MGVDCGNGKWMTRDPFSGEVVVVDSEADEKRVFDQHKRKVEQLERRINRNQDTLLPDD